MRKYYIYIHKTKTDNRVFYVGCGTKQRCYVIKKSSRSKEWYDIYKNEGLRVEILHVTTDEEEAFLLEKDYIAKYKRICDGGTLVNKATFKSSKKMTDNTKRKLSEINKGKILSVEHKNKIRLSNPNRKPILQYTKDDEFIKEWTSITEASTTLNINRSNIRSCCQNKNYKTAGGYIWKWKS